MSETYETPPSDPTDGRRSRPDGDGLPPKTGGDLPRRGADDSVDPGMPGEGGDSGGDTGGMAGEG
ncbi:hypothetical protein LJR225_003102 [Phenylobacterium sp. LjRoot225]|uniref:hypothetical protein n=1 Tax=Phenylobacterium sp. LjRoot225 TaxID=3342285 RepID=UPI003ED02AD9